MVRRNLRLGGKLEFWKLADMSGVPSDWESSKGIAKAILHDRGMRRKWLARWLVLTLGWMAVGLWVIDGWLGGDAWRFLIWWGICGVLACVLMVFALYDALAVIREEREKVSAGLTDTAGDPMDAKDE